MSEQIVLVILEDESGRVALQLRDDLPEVAYGDHWGLFGGHVEEGENPAVAIRRELTEELGISIESKKVRQLETFQIENRFYYLFLYSLIDELNSAKLAEGRRYGVFGRSEIEKSAIDSKVLIPHHLVAMKRYWKALT